MNVDRHCLTRAMTRTELLVILTILAVIAAPVVRVIFADEVRAFDQALFRQLGIDPGVGRFATAALWLIALVAWAAYRAVARRRRARIEKQPFLRIPRRNAQKT